MRILIASDTWTPQTNGVVHTLRHTTGHLEQLGHQVHLVTPEQFRTAACPGYAEIRLAVGAAAGVRDQIERFSPDAIHVATEGPIGFAVRAYCRRHQLRFTTSWHTRFPEYLRQRLPVPLAWSYAGLRRFHRAGARCMVNTSSMRQLLEARGFGNLVMWRRGVDAQLFRPRAKSFLDLPRPVAVYVGRLAVEKNVDAFLEMRWSGSKLLIGDGPERARLQRAWPGACFAGYRHGEELARYLAAADVMVFPSRTDTFGLVNLEAMACGVPVAAFPVPGPRDVIRDGETGVLDRDLAVAARRALSISPAACRAWAEQQGWAHCTSEFESNLVPCAS